MRTTIKVTELSLAQWDHVQDQLQETYDIPDGAVRVCVEFEVDPELSPRHVEMPVRVFVGFLTRLARIQHHAELAASGTTCDHGAAVVAETPSAFEGADPVRDYGDGCQSFGPYRSVDT